MNILKDENKIINLIKYGPILLVLIVSVIVTVEVIKHQNDLLNHDIKILKTSYLEENKERVKVEVLRFINTVEIERNNLTKIIQNDIKNRVYQAHAIATEIYNKESQKENYNSQKTLQRIKDVLSVISFNDKRGYIFIDDINGKKVLHPIKELEGKNLLEFKDANGYQFVKTIVKTIKNKSESFDTYYWYKGSDTSKSYEKIGFYKYFEPYDLAIGTGEYKVDVVLDLQKRLLARIQNAKMVDNGYVFVSDTNGVSLSHIKKEFIGTNRLEVKDYNGRSLVGELIKFVKKNGDGYIEYTPPPSHKDIIDSKRKISYITLYDEWNWVIGSGFYMENLNKKIAYKKKQLLKSNKYAIKKILLISLFITIILVILSFYISKFIKNRFTIYKAKLKDEIRKTIEKEKLLVQQSKMATMGEMIGNIVHQWKQPLSLLSMSNSILKMGKEEPGVFSEKQINDAMTNVDVAIENISTTIDDFRNFLNPKKQRILFNIEDAFKETFKLLKSQFKNSEVDVIQNIDEVDFFGSQNELQQTLINLLKNAKEELIKLDKSAKKMIFIDVYEQNNHAIIKIKDNANGIPDDIISNVFEAYFSTKEQDGGSGIGLYMCEQIVEGSMKGTITVSNVDFEYENKLYKGAQFIISLPLDLRNKSK